MFKKIKNKNGKPGSICNICNRKKTQINKVLSSYKIEERNTQAVQKEGIHMLDRHIK